MTARAEAVKLIEFVPDSEINILLEVIRKFVPDPDDIATPDDIAAHEQAMKEYRAGEAVSIDDVDWS